MVRARLFAERTAAERSARWDEDDAGESEDEDEAEAEGEGEGDDVILRAQLGSETTDTTLK